MTAYGYIQNVHPELYNEPHFRDWHDRKARHELFDKVADNQWVRLPIARKDQPMRWEYTRDGPVLAPSTWANADMIEMRWLLETKDA